MRDDCPRTEQALAHVTAVHDDQLERSASASPLHAQPSELQSPDHRAGSPHDDDHAEAQPGRDRLVGEWPCVKQHERVVVAGRGAPWDSRRDAEMRRRMRPEREARRSQRQPLSRRTRASQPDDPRTAAQVEGKAGAADVDGDPLRAGVPDPHIVSPLPLSASRAGAAVRATGGAASIAIIAR